MRIRKRFQLSSLSSLPLSDPQLHRSPAVQQHRQTGAQTHPDGNLGVQVDDTPFQPSDPPNQPSPPAVSDQIQTIGSGSGWVCSGSVKTQELNLKGLEGEEAKEERWEEEEKSNDVSKRIIPGVEVGSGLLPPTVSSHQDVGRWSEGDKAVPPKKRRVNLDAIMVRENKPKAKMKSKTNKKCLRPNGEEEKAAKQGTKNTKKLKRGNVIMEGSRCSRVNGRGWRCCQPTLVGYSLCEHHLGKGRLKSMNTTSPGQSIGATTKPQSDKLSNTWLLVQKQHQLGQRILAEDDDDTDQDDDDDDDGGGDEGEPVMRRRKKRMIVKARSLSSLMGQTNSSVVVAADHSKNKGSV